MKATIIIQETSLVNFPSFYNTEKNIVDYKQNGIYIFELYLKKLLNYKNNFDFIIATTNHKKDDFIEEIAKKLKIKYYRIDYKEFFKKEFSYFDYHLTSIFSNRYIDLGFDRLFFYGINLYSNLKYLEIKTLPFMITSINLNPILDFFLENYSDKIDNNTSISFTEPNDFTINGLIHSFYNINNYKRVVLNQINSLNYIGQMKSLELKENIFNEIETILISNDSDIDNYFKYYNNEINLNDLINTFKNRKVQRNKNYNNDLRIKFFLNCYDNEELQYNELIFYNYIPENIQQKYALIINENFLKQNIDKIKNCKNILSINVLLNKNFDTEYIKEFLKTINKNIFIQLSLKLKNENEINDFLENIKNEFKIFNISEDMFELEKLREKKDFVKFYDFYYNTINNYDIHNLYYFIENRKNDFDHNKYCIYKNKVQTFYENKKILCPYVKDIIINNNNEYLKKESEHCKNCNKFDKHFIIFE